MLRKYIKQAVLDNTFRLFFRFKKILFLGILALVTFLTYNNMSHFTTTKLNITSISPLIHTRSISSLIHTRFLELTNNSLVLLPTTTMDVASESLFNISNDTSKPSYILWGPRESATDLPTNRHPYDDRVLAQLLLLFDKSSSLMTQQSQKKRILVPRIMKQWWIPDKNDSLELERCTFGKKCELVFEGTSEAYRYRRNISGAIIVGHEYGSYVTKNTVYRQHFPDDVLVFFYTQESNFVTNARLMKQNDILASQWTGSDIVTPYAKWVYHDPSIRRHISDKNYAAGKTKLAAIFVSNCNPSNTRNRYLQLLKKYIQIDVYGSCGGTHTCPRSNNENECYLKLKKEYKFYLAFENANCRDYITEKFWYTALNNDLVPVVLGAHPEDYRTAGPMNSYIHVEDFDSPRQLGAYLQYLDKHDEEYNKYFEWKGTGKFIHTFFLCRVCLMLYYAEIVQPPARNQSLELNSVGITSNLLCLPKDQAYWTRDVEMN